MAPKKPIPIPILTAGRTCLSVVAIVTSAGCYIADWNDTHVMNPKWPPHARFHNGQTMSMGLCLGLITAYFAWRPFFKGEGIDEEIQSVTIAAVMGSLYWVTGMSAILYPGTRWMDPEFGDEHEAPQVPIFSGLIALAWMGWFLEMRRLKKLAQVEAKVKA